MLIFVWTQIFHKTWSLPLNQTLKSTFHFISFHFIHSSIERFQPNSQTSFQFLSKYSFSSRSTTKGNMFTSSDLESESRNDVTLSVRLWSKFITVFMWNITLVLEEKKKKKVVHFQWEGDEESLFYSVGPKPWVSESVKGTSHCIEAPQSRLPRDLRRPWTRETSADRSVKSFRKKILHEAQLRERERERERNDRWVNLVGRHQAFGGTGPFHQWQLRLFPAFLRRQLPEQDYIEWTRRCLCSQNVKRSNITWKSLKIMEVFE
jgi:hypothetical protein